VDKMVMETLRPAQEARQGGGLGSVGHPVLPTFFTSSHLRPVDPPSSPGRPADKGGKVPGISAVNNFYSGSDSASSHADNHFC